MKKILLGTTGLVGAALLASAASAETPKVTLGGFSNFQAGYIDQEVDSTKDFSFRNDNEVSVNVDGKTESGLGYGAVIDLEADITTEADNQGVNASRTYTYLEGAWGRAEMGGNQSAAATMRVDASSLAVATGGINGAWTYFVTAPTDGFISTSKLAAEHGVTTGYGDETTYNATKVTYYTPSWYGLQGGISYTPQADLTKAAGIGQVAAVAGTTAGYNDVLDLGLSYNYAFDNDLTLGVAGTYEQGVDRAGSEDMKGWNLGAIVGAYGFEVAGSYGELDNIVDGGANALAAGSNGEYWTAGLGYEMGPIGLSATYLDSNLNATGGDNEFTHLVFGADYKLAPGLTPYAEVSLFDADSVTTANDNDGTLVIVGTQVAF